MQLASSVHAGPGVYALLVGSGISVAAGVPSGTQVARELIERLATSLREDTDGDPFAWYRDHTGAEPDYRSLLNEIAPSQADRRNLLSGNFEPSNGVDGESDRTPTKAHRAIARLVADGFVKVIVTTNFDRLLETAFAEAGIDAQVISSAADATVAQPLVHSACTVIKVNGDYLSVDLKNTAEELDSYDPAIDKLLTQVFDEYGLVVCGWSAQLDTALCETIRNAPDCRYSTYWMDRGKLTVEANDLVDRRQARRVPIEDADSAFEHLYDTVTALSQAPQQRPADTTASVQQLKLHMSDPSRYIRLYDLMVRETERVIEAIADLPTSGVDLDAAYPERMHRYEIASAPLMALLATGAFFSRDDDRDQTWVATIDRLARREMAQSGYNVLLNMQQYPTLLAMYAVAFGAAAAGRIDPVARVLGSVKVAEHGLTVPVGVAASSFQVLDYDRMRATVPGLERHRVPFSQRLFDALRPTVTEIIRDDQRYKELFDQIEYLFGLACYAGIGVGPVGLGAHRRPVGPVEPPDGLIQSNRDALIEAGVFTDANHLEACRAAYNEEFESAHRRRW